MFEVNGSDALRKQPQESESSGCLMPGVHLADLITPGVLFAAEDEMFEASGFEIHNAQDFANILDEVWDLFIRDNTAFLAGPICSQRPNQSGCDSALVPVDAGVVPLPKVFFATLSNSAFTASGIGAPQRKRTCISGDARDG